MRSIKARWLIPALAGLLAFSVAVPAEAQAGSGAGSTVPAVPSPLPDTAELRWLEETHPDLWRLVEGLPWARDGLTASEGMALEDLLSISVVDIAVFRSVLGLSWVLDAISVPEGESIGALARLSQGDAPVASVVIAMPWFLDGVTETEAGAVRSLARLVDGDDTGGGVIGSVVALGWLGDGIDETEGDLLFWLANLYALSGEAAAAVVGMPFLSSVERDDVLALRSLEWLARAADVRLPAVLTHPNLSEGITDGDTTLVAAVGAVRGARGARRFIGRSNPRIRVVSATTERTPNLKISVVRADAQPRQSTIDDIRDAVEFVEGVMNRPLPVGHIIVVVDEAADVGGGTNNGFAFGVRPDTERRLTPYDEFSFRSQIVRQTAYFFWRGHASWIDEGAANTIEYLWGVDAGVSPGVRRVPRRGTCEVHDLGMLAERDTVPGQRSGDGCGSFLGQSLFLELLEDMGRGAFLAGLGRLYRLSRETEDTPEGGMAGIGRVREAFPDHGAVVERYWSGALNAPGQRPVDDEVLSHRLVRWDRTPSYDGVFVTFDGTLLGGAVLSRETVAAARAFGWNFTLYSDIPGRNPTTIIPPPASGRPPPNSEINTIADDYELGRGTFSVRFRFPQTLGDPSDYVVLVWGYQDKNRSSFFGFPVDAIGDVRIQAADPAPTPSGRFSDDDGSVHEANIEIIAELGITQGCGDPEDNTFCPKRTVARSHLMAFLARALGVEEDAGVTTSRFSDVPDGAWYLPALERLADLGVVEPFEDGTFRPAEPVTRLDMAVFMSRAFPHIDKVDDPVGVFADVPAGNVHAGEVEGVHAAGVTTGCGKDPLRYCPDRPVRRDQIASFLVRALRLEPSA